jgi:biopolymer transport protein ExbD
VAINVVPMVDVIFCLCVFFMCSMKFKQLEGKFDSWLPKDKGAGGTPAEIQETRVALFWDVDKQTTRAPVRDARTRTTASSRP